MTDASRAMEDYADPEFTGRQLENLVIAIEIAVGGMAAGNTPLGRAVIRLAEDALAKDEGRALLTKETG